MHKVPTRESDTRRLTEVDAEFRSLNMRTSMLVGVVGAAMVPKFGIGFGLFTALPVVYWLVRLSPARRLLTLRDWNLLMIAMLVVAIAGCSFCSGGADSTFLFFAGVVALLGQALFAHLRRFVALGIGLVASLVAIDLAIGRSIDLTVTTGALVMAGYLPFFVERMVRVEQDQRRRAVVDQLTGCLNRHALDARTVEIEEQGALTGAGVSVIMFDLDHFKTINDVHGHALGDRVLSHVAYLARKELRRFELMYRLGGEEFAILLPGMGLDMASRIAETVREAISTSMVDGVRVTASFGVAALGAPFTIDDALAMADRRMYEAKRLGRNRVVDVDSIGLITRVA